MFNLIKAVSFVAPDLNELAMKIVRFEVQSKLARKTVLIMEQIENYLFKEDSLDFASVTKAELLDTFNFFEVPIPI